MVLQDDVATAGDFEERVLKLVAARPKDAISLFVEWGSRTATAARLAAATDADWTAVVDDYVPTVGLVVPADVARGLDEFAASRSTTDVPDDVVLFEYLRSAGIETIAPVDGPLQHDSEDSLVGNSIMGIRRAVRFTDRLDRPVGGFVFRPTVVPYYDWWDQQAALFVPDSASADGWRRLRSEPAFALLEISRDVADRTFEDWSRALVDRDELSDTVSAIIQRELWRTAYLIGVALGGLSPVPRALESVRVGEALRTLGPGGLRRIVPVHRLDAVTSLLQPLVAAGTHAGLEAGMARLEPAQR
ncbi:hypothetical protein F1C12_05410 [Leifsonia shinshuensis]|uniref:Uncharacterized protein n=1 Tax=Leifsonia shinshuensis TaxID=150026 RepID=A0A7G6Y7Z9_9MICO|nr:hypothetical protein F1C12_05410 [Leifsonia shinshuensis]